MSESIGFGKDGFDWDRYARVRPKYPESLWQQILEYHHNCSKDGRLDTVHDVGAGHGIVAKELLSRQCRHVFVSDPSAHNIRAARQYLHQEADQGKVTFKQCGGETPWLADASLDMITAFECIHWMDADQAISSMAAALKPGGTLAVVFYFPEPYIRRNKEIGRAWQDIWDKFGHELRESTDWGFLQQVLHRSADGLHSALPLSPELFQAGARRIRINVDLLKGSPHGDPNHPFYFRGFDELYQDVPDHVCAQDQISNLIDEDWAQTVDLSWLKDTMQGMQPALPAEQTTRQFVEIDRALQQDGGQTSVFWVADVVLATKK